MKERTFLNLGAVMPHVGAVICHGGNGTVYQALACGVPILCVTDHFEQDWNVQALERHHLGQRLDTASLSADDVADLIEDWMTRKNGSAHERISHLIDLEHSRGECRRHIMELLIDVQPNRSVALHV